MNHGRLVPSFVQARSPSGLRRLMFKTNLKHGAQMQYFDIQTYTKRGKQYFLAWFFIGVNSESIKEIMEDGEEV